MAWALIGAGCGGGRVEPAPDAEPSSAELLCDREGLAPAARVELAVRVVLADGWHTYANPPGDSGMAPVLRIAAPDGFGVGTLRLPPHRAFTDAAGTTFGYEDEVLMRVDLAAPPGLRAGDTVTIGAELDYLVCRDICLPRRASLSIELPVAAETPPVRPDWPDVLRRGGWPADPQKGKEEGR